MGSIGDVFAPVEEHLKKGGTYTASGQGTTMTVGWWEEQAVYYLVGYGTSGYLSSSLPNIMQLMEQQGIPLSSWEEQGA